MDQSNDITESFAKLSINSNTIQLPVYKDNEIAGYATIDKEDEELVSKYKLMVSRDYVYTYKCSLHGLILGNIVKDKQIDHINGDKYDNRRCNLRVVSPSVNSQNKAKASGSSSQYRGVSLYKNNRYRSTFCGIYIGIFEKEENAAYAYDEYIKENFPNDGYILNGIEKPNDYIKYIVKSVSKETKGICKKGDKYESAYYNSDTKKHSYIGRFNTYEEAKEAYEKKKKEIENDKKEKMVIQRNDEDVAILTVKNKGETLYTMVDDDIYEKCHEYTFNLDKDGYVRISIKEIGRLNRFVFGEEAKGKKVRYINNQNRLDNRRQNLYLQ